MAARAAEQAKLEAELAAMEVETGVLRQAVGSHRTRNCLLPVRSEGPLCSFSLQHISFAKVSSRPHMR